MSEPKRLVESGASGFEQKLLRSWDSEGPSARARQRALAIAGSGTAAALTASGAQAGVNTGAKAALVGVVGKWLTAGALVGLATSAASLAYLDSGAQDARDAREARDVAPAVAVEEPPAVGQVIETVSASASPVTDEVAPEVAPLSLQRAPSVSTVPRTKSAAPASRPRSTLTEQIQLLDRARNALRAGQAGQAGALVAQYQRDFPRGGLAQEAELLRIDVLLHQGQRAQAQAAARRFLMAHPSSTHAERLRSLSADETNP